ncbi:hypothetical protein [Clostridium weizhouense]|uniref:Stage VI sporulation protein F n=1 Tax=Clostridium weizhouense TaxID=2859781 RepID=A0ABS7ARN9_9CLOT|nr:hypothetical protein [Clostridium weizhouense]MBW6411335.1 hypothetical protein [Clostridium weizhouense]
MGLFNKLKEIVLVELGDDDAAKLSRKFLDFVNNEADKRDRNKNSILKLARNMDNKSDDELKRIYQTSSGDMKIAAGYLLKQRGY